MNSAVRPVLSVCLLSLFLACQIGADPADAATARGDAGTTDLGGGGQDAHTSGTDAYTSGTDASISRTDAAGTDTSSPQSCSRSGFTPVYQFASTTGFGIEYAGYSALEAPLDMIQVQRYDSFGGPTQPGTYSLDGINYADCGLCLMARSGCQGNTCDKVFYSQQGSVDITAIGALGQQFSATLNNVVFQEVTIDAATFVSTPVPGGETWCLDGYSFDEQIRTEEDAVCGRDDLACVGEIVNDFSLQNCDTGSMVSLSSLAAGNKALWLVAVAGWCTACSSYIPQVWSTYQSRKSEGLEVVYVLGENQYQNGQPTLDYCRGYLGNYTQHGVDVANFYIDHDGQTSFATTFGNMWIYPDSDGQFGLPWSALIDADDLNYSYADGAGGNLDSTLNTLLAD